MRSLIEELRRREAAVRAEADRLRTRIEELSEDLARADEQVSRLVIAREEVARVLEGPAVAEPPAGQDGAEPAGKPRRPPLAVAVTVPPWQEGAEALGAAAGVSGPAGSGGRREASAWPATAPSQSEEITAEASAASLPARRTGADSCIRYLNARHEYLRYDQALAEGWPIATGVIEGACRHLIADCLDIGGARWGMDGAEAVLTLRAVISNGDFEEYWRFHLAREHQRLYPGTKQGKYALGA